MSSRLAGRLEIKKKSDDEGKEWFVVTKNGKEVYHCMTREMADKWMSIDKLNKN